MFLDRLAARVAACAPLVLLGFIAAPVLAATECPPTSIFTTELGHLEGYRFFVGTDGDTEVEPYRIDARIVPLLKTGQKLGILDLPAMGRRADQIVVGPADLDLPLHPPPYKEMFVMLGGSTMVMTKKFKTEVGPGSVLFFDDVGATFGHGGRTGPCGYISLSIAP